MENAAVAESNNMDESLGLESRLVQVVREGDIERTKDLLQEKLEQMRLKDVEERIQLFWKLFDSCVTDFAEKNYNVSHELSSARRSSLENYVMFMFLVTKLQEDDAIMAKAPSLSREFLFKPVWYTMRMAQANRGSELANRITHGIQLHQEKVRLEILQLANGPDNSEDLEMAKRLFGEQLEKVRPETPEFLCTFFEGILDMLYTHLIYQLR